MFHATGALVQGSNKQTQHWRWNPGLHTVTRKVFLLPLCYKSLTLLPATSVSSRPLSKRGALGLSSAWRQAVLLSLFLQKVESLPEKIKCKYSVFNQGCPRQSFNSYLYLPFKNTIWLICIIFRGKIVIFYYTIGTRALCLYTKNMIRKEIIQTTNPS